MARILNLTQHATSAAQVAEGVVEPQDKAAVQQLLTFTTPPCQRKLAKRASQMAQIAQRSRADSAMIGGAPFFMAPLAAALKAVGVKPLYAFSVRESVESTQPDGSVVKKAVFRHKGWVAG